MCNEFSFENLFYGIYGLQQNTSGHLWKSFGHNSYLLLLGGFEGVSDKRKDHASWRHHIDVILGDVPIHVALCHMARGPQYLPFESIAHCCFLYWKFMKSLFVTLFVVILPFFTVTIPGMFPLQMPTPATKSVNMPQTSPGVHRENMELIRIPKRKHHLDIENHCTIFYHILSFYRKMIIHWLKIRFISPH